MSIETLLEAAKFLELQAQQQQKAREESEWREKLHFEQLVEHRRSDVTYTSPIRINHVTRGEEPRAERRPTPVPPPPLPPPSMPITVVPVSVVTSNHTGLTPPLAPPAHPSPGRDPHSPQGQGPPSVKPNLSPSAGSGNHKQHHHHLQQQRPPHPLLLSQSCNPRVQQPVQLVQPYSVVVPPQHTILLPQQAPPKPPQHTALLPQQVPLKPPQNALLPQQVPLKPPQNALLPQPPPPKPPQNAPLPQPAPPKPPQHTALLPQPAPPKPPQNAPQTSPVCRGSPPDDGRHQDRKRPGGRAHLKECFDTLKKNLPNVDDKKTSNLSVLRSALRYIQTLKRKEKEYEHEMERLAREKISTQQRLAELKKELSQWMDVMDIERVLRLTAQPEEQEEDQASTSTASEGEEDPVQDPLEDSPETCSPTPAAIQPHLRPAATATPLLPPHIQPHPAPALSGATATPLHQTLLPAPSPAATSLQPSVITAHASAAHPSVIQAVSHVLQAPGARQQPIGHITLLGPRLPALYPAHLTHSLSQGQVKGLAGPGQAAASGGPTALVVGGKQSSAQVMTHHHHHHHHHPQLVSQAVTMVTMPSFPVTTLKLA